MRYFILTPIILLALILSGGCATILGGKVNTLVFEGTDLEGAEIYIDHEKTGEAPGKIEVPAEMIQHGSHLEIRKEGYRSQEYLILRKPHPGYVAADFLLGVVPLIIDTATGNILRPSPRKFFVELEKEGAGHDQSR